ncbi:PAS domain-containing protein [Rhodanobacter sp. 7MK24]|uniref:sensor histidine kinase n=1 Tax=Rhodanobacter sp. 7MK24 TaxID=2775922 RepID=UPI0017874805|nr:ATP-binding protein [Rhodanobacter sp. 7MK24]MBD8881620.1 PAS domain-containing protein [Rhodanobacter sp. 7MK24]
MKTQGLPRWRFAGLLLAMVVIVALPYFAMRVMAEQTQQANLWLNHASTIKVLTYRIAYLIRDSEAASYRILAGDGDASVEQRALEARGRIPSLLDQLHALTLDSPEQQASIGALESVVNGRITLVNQALARMHKGDAGGARQSLRDAGDLFRMNTLTDDIVQSADRLLAERGRDVKQQVHRSQFVLGLIALAQLLLLIVVVVTSERQIGKRQLAETREGRAVLRSQMIVQAVREPIGLFDEQLRSLLVNAAFGELYGLDPKHQRALSLPQIGNGAWSDGALLQRLNDVLLRDRELWDYEVVQHTPDGVDRHVVVNARRIQQQDSDAQALLLTVSDVTARALAEHKVNELNHQLEGKVAQITDVNRELEAFSYSVSHDLRAPLRHIAGFARKLRQHLGEQVDETGVHYLDVIGDSAQRMGQLIEDLLVFSRLGRGALRLQPVDMQSLAEEARALCVAETSERRISWSMAPLPIVVGDENMLRTVWQNLIGNAVKYTGQREVAHIAVDVQRSRNGDYVFTVSDDGAGFDMQYADKLFGVFQRLHRASDFPGNGIGLANVRRILARHGGRAWAEAEPDHGARFHFSLPARDLSGITNEGFS